MRVTRHQSVTREKLELAKRLRQHMTREERTIWQALKGNALGNLHFRRQQVIAGYVVDFYCASAALAVEIDGEPHLAQTESDSERDRALAVLGIETIRFSNDEVASDLGAVLRKIAARARSRLRAAT